jgi:hypothetical protein
MLRPKNTSQAIDMQGVKATLTGVFENDESNAEGALYEPEADSNTLASI